MHIEFNRDVNVGQIRWANPHSDTKAWYMTNLGPHKYRYGQHNINCWGRTMPK